MYLVDTDVMIDVQRGYAPAIAWFASASELPSIPGWPTETDCARALSDFTAYHLSHNVGLIDSLIAACAVGLNEILCTFNVKHYRVIPGLSIEQPYSR